MLMERKFWEVAELWRAEKGKYVKESTMAAYGTIIRNHLIPYFGDKNDITQEEVQSFVLQKHSTGLSNKSIKDAVIVLKMILRFGEGKGIFPLHHVKVHYPLEIKDNSVPTLAKSDQIKIMNYIEENPGSMNIGIYICLTTGLRIGEICALRWEDVDLETAVISVRRTLQRIYMPENRQKHTKLVMGAPKTANSVRLIPIGKTLVRLMKGMVSGHKETDYVISGSEKPIEPRSYRNHYKRLLASLDISDIRFHCLRHTFATRCVESRCDYKTLSTLLGHSNISTTMDLYVHPGIIQKRECVEQMIGSIFPAT